MTPTKKQAETLSLYIISESAIPLRKVATEDSFVAAWNGHEFETIEVVTHGYDARQKENYFYFKRQASGEEYMEVYYPLDPRMTRQDIAGAIRAYPNTDNTGWLFQHCDQDYMRDQEYRLRSAVHTAFEFEIDKARWEVDNRIHTVFIINNDANRSAVGLARRVHKGLQDFRHEVAVEIVRDHRKRHIGWYHQNPQHAHLHDPLAKAIRAVKARWEADWAHETRIHVGPIISKVLEQVTILFNYETRWDMAARLEAEKKAAEAAAETPTETPSEEES